MTTATGNNRQGSEITELPQTGSKFRRDVLDHIPDADDITQTSGYVIYDPDIGRYLHYSEDTDNEIFAWFEISEGLVFTGNDVPGFSLGTPIEDRMLDFSRYENVRLNIDLRRCVLLPAVMHVHYINTMHCEVFVEVDFLNGFNFLDAIKNSDRL